MRQYLALSFGISAGLLSAQEFRTGQAARLVIGQETFTALRQGASQSLVGGVGGLALANDTLFVTDANRMGADPINQRVLIFPNISRQFPGLRESYGADRKCQVCGGVAGVVIGQPDFTKRDPARTRTGVRLPTAVATDGAILAIADTQNNRVLIWNSIPTANGAPADVVVGQTDFTSFKQPIVVDQTSLRGPQGVWIQGTRLFVADTQNHRVLIWNTIPTRNNQPADLVIGQPNFTTAFEPPVTFTGVTSATAERLLDPVSVTSDGTRLIVTDLGHNRVVIWDSIPNANGVAANRVIGQKDFTSASSNASRDLCESNGTADNQPTYPRRCAATLNFPRYALSDGRRLFIADGGNDRILVYNEIPTQPGARADVILGQPDEFTNVVSDQGGFFEPPPAQGRPDQIRTPASLAWDGSTLFATDPFQRRVVAFSVNDGELKADNIRNAASLRYYASGSISFSGTVKENDEATIKVEDTEYKYKIVKDDNFEKVIRAFVSLINAGAGDANVLAIANIPLRAIQFSSRIPGPAGNDIGLTASVSTGAEIVLTVNTPFLSGGREQRPSAPGAIISIFGENFTNRTESVSVDAPTWPLSLAGVEVYMNGFRLPLQYASPGQLNAQLLFDQTDITSANLYVRTVRPDGSVTVTNPVAVRLDLTNPGLFAVGELDPRAAVAFHGSSFGNTTVSVDGTVTTGNTATVRIEDRDYSYTAVANDTLTIIRDKLVELINANAEEKLTAIPSGQFTRILLRAKVAGPDGNGIAVAVSTSANASVALSVTKATTSGANTEGAPVTEENPAAPGELIVLYASGLGPVSPQAAFEAALAGVAYNGPPNTAAIPVSAFVGGNSATVLGAGLKKGAIGIYEVVLELPSALETNPLTEITISQEFSVSNIVRIPVTKPEPPPAP
ncbi:MAG: hypothetical protein K2X35_04115 [Bryobacteraceae bacterium]|nr:hypothetical protein [Bryobacteraceae bacterium]